MYPARRCTWRVRCRHTWVDTYRYTTSKYFADLCWQFRRTYLYFNKFIGRRNLMNKIDDALKALPSDLTWAQAMDVVGEAVLPIWKISGKVAADDQLSDVDRRRLADAIVKQQTSTKEEITMTSTNEAAAAMFADAEQRQFLLAAAKHREQLRPQVQDWSVGELPWPRARSWHLSGHSAIAARRPSIPVSH